MDSFFEVEDIVGSRFSSGRREYLVRWAGYDDTENSWEPEQMLHEDCPDLLRNYLSRDSAKPNELGTPLLQQPKILKMNGETPNNNISHLQHSTPRVSIDDINNKKNIKQTLDDSLEAEINRITSAHLKNANSFSDRYFVLQFFKETACLLIILFFSIVIVPLLVPVFNQ